MPELRTSTLNKAHPKKTRREKFVGAANQPECEKKMDMTGQKVEWCVQRSH